jgi:hypothetical protein
MTNPGGSRAGPANERALASWSIRRRVCAGAAALAFGFALLALAAVGTLEAHFLSEAAGVSEGDGEGVGGFVRVANQVEKPLLYAAFAVLPLALIAGGGLTMIGNQRGPRILGYGIGGAMVLAAVGGFAA